MRKKIVFLLLIGSLFFYAFTFNAFALPFPLSFIQAEGFVNPYSATVTDQNDGTLKFTGLVYSFTVTDASPGNAMEYLQLEFENDVFKTVPTAYNYDPAGWLGFSWEGASLLVSYNTTNPTTFIGAGETLSFTVDAVIFKAALNDPSFWQEGSIWGQSWAAAGTMGGIDGGSTAPVPEPTAMLLFGTGLAAFGFIGRRFKKS